VDKEYFRIQKTEFRIQNSEEENILMGYGGSRLKGSQLYLIKINLTSVHKKHKFKVTTRNKIGGIYDILPIAHRSNQDFWNRNVYQ